MITKVSNIATVTLTAWFIKVIGPKTSGVNVPGELCCDCGNFVTGSIAVSSTLRSSEQLFCPNIPKKICFHLLYPYDLLALLISFNLI